MDEERKRNQAKISGDQQGVSNSINSISELGWTNILL